MSAVAAPERTGWRAQLVYGLLVLVIFGAAGYAVWYRSYYNIWPGQGATARVHWCERDYQDMGGPLESWRQVNADGPVRAFGTYPPLGLTREQVFAPISPGAAPGDCATAVYLRTGPDRYRPYSLLGGP